MRYIVSGYRRTGTSMMVRALCKGIPGTRILYQRSLEESWTTKAPEINSYRPNPGGLWEVTQMRYLDPRFLRSIPDQSITKVLFDGLPALPAAEWTVVFMARDPAEIEASLEAVHRYIEARGGRTGFEDPCAVYKNDDERFWPFDAFAPFDRAEIDHVLRICDQRKDIRLFIVRHDEILADPVAAFIKLHNEGLHELEVHAAAKVVNPEFYRARKEDGNTNHTDQHL